MTSTSSTALTLLIAWALLLLIVMELLRVRLVLTGAIAGPEFRPDNANLSPFMQRLTRAQANCIEGLPIFGGLLIVALLMNRTDITNGLAMWLLSARVVQSLVHLSSLSVLAVNTRFAAFSVQMGIAVYWSWALIVR
jgi:uncharacterized MAPEG superfamily protein